MKNKLLLLLALTGLSLPALSQTADSAEFKNELGIVASPSLQYLFQNKSLPVGLIYKRQVKPDQAWRYIVKGWYRNQKTPVITYSDGSSYYALKQTDYQIQALVGYEWQKELSARWQFYYGADAGAGYTKYNTKIEITDNVPASYYFSSFGYSNSHTLFFTLKPMAGIRFNLSRNLYLATETNIAINYGLTKQKHFQTAFYDTPDPQTTETPSYTSSSALVNFAPLANIQLVYKF